MLINLLLAFILFGSPGGAGSSMDPNGIILSDSVVPDPPPRDPPTSYYSGCVDPNG